MPSRQDQFEALVNAYSTDLYRYAVWLCHDSTVAEDLVQETFLRAWKALDKLRDPGAAKSWLITILRRENARRFERLRLDSESLDQMDLDRIAGFDPGFGKAETLVLHRALRELPGEYREPLLLQVLGGFSARDIAGMIDSTPGAVNTRVFRARQMLRAAMDGGQDRKKSRATS